MTQKRTRENLNRLPREVEATLPSWVKCTYPISSETLEEVRSTVLVWLANVRNYVQETNQHFPYDEQPHPEEFDDGDGAWVFFVETHLCTDSRADSRLNHGEVDFEWFARFDLRRKNIVIASLNLNIFKPRLWSAFIRQMILSDVNVPKIGESDLRDIVVGSVELKPYDRTYIHGYTQQRGMLRLEVVFNDDLTVGISSEIKDEICSKLESAVQALKSRISRICGINELERRTRRTRI